MSYVKYKNIAGYMFYSYKDVAGKNIFILTGKAASVINLNNIILGLYVDRTEYYSISDIVNYNENKKELIIKVALNVKRNINYHQPHDHNLLYLNLKLTSKFFKAILNPEIYFFPKKKMTTQEFKEECDFLDVKPEVRLYSLFDKQIYGKI